jgi:putative membrane protein
MQEYISPNERFYRRLIFLVSIAVFSLIVILSQLPKSASIPSWAAVLPAFNAILNGTCFILLLFSLYFIRRKNIVVHRQLNLTACVLSTIFLLSYVTFHAFGVETHFPVDNPARPLYLFILITHIILAAIVLPLVLLSLYRGLTNQVALHRKIVRWSYPVWLYVTLSGVIVYMMISPYYQF